MKCRLNDAKRLSWLASCLIVIASANGFAQDIETMRLFFTPAERAAVTLLPDSGTATAYVEQDAERSDQALVPSSPISAAKSKHIASAVKNTALITFNALITSRSGFSIILNGLPCKSFSSTDVQAQTTGQVMLGQSCPHLQKRKFQLIVDSHNYSLKVIQEGNLLGILSVGDSL